MSNILVAIITTIGTIVAAVIMDPKRTRPMEGLSKLRLLLFALRKYASIAVLTLGIAISAILVLHHYLQRGSFTLGAVITSSLPWEGFTRANGLSAEFDPTNSVWCPCDGTPIVGSELNRLDGSLFKAPDLRGVFIRGRNAFTAADGDTVPASQRDPDGKRADIYVIQSSAVVSHIHACEPGGAGDLNGRDGMIVALGSAQTKTISFQTAYNKDGKSETRPVNAALYYYIRVNR